MDKTELEKATVSHGQWKQRLRDVIDSGKTDIPVATICSDSRCAFGQWLASGEVQQTAAASPHYQNIKHLHAEFHRVAGAITQLALDGHTAEAEQKMAFGGEFAVVSARLISALMEWKQAL